MLAKNRSLRLRGSVAALALISMFPLAAEAQLSGINLGIEGSWSSGEEDWGTQATILVPLINSPAGMFYTMASGGWQHHDPAGSVGFGYRHLYEGGWGWGVYGSGDAQRSINNNKFFGATTGLEVFIPSGISVSTNVYVPLGKKNKVVNGTGNAGTVVLKDKTTGGACNPTAPAQVCKLVIDGSKGATIEHNRFGVDLTVAYEMQMGGISVTPFVAGYVFDRVNNTGLAGIMAGVDVNVPLTAGISLNGGLKARYDREQKTDFIVGFGVNIQLGQSSQGKTLAMQKAPRRLPASMRIQEDVAPTIYNQDVIWDRNTGGLAVSEVRFVNIANQAQADVLLSDTPESGILIFNGDIMLPNATLSISAGHVGLISGSTVLNLKGAQDGHLYTFTAPGTKGIITQNDSAVDIISSTNNTNVILENLSLSKGMIGVRLLGLSDGRIYDVQMTNTAGDGFRIVDSNSSIFDKVTITNAGGKGFAMSSADDMHLNFVNVNNSKNEAIHFANVHDSEIINTTVSKTATNSGIKLENAENVLVDQFKVGDIATNMRAIDIIGVSNDITISNGTVSNSSIGVSVEGGTNVHLTNLTIQRTAVGMNTIGVRTVGTSNITFTNVDVQKFVIGYLLPTGVTVIDGGFNKASGNTANCDAVANDATGSIRINMGAQTCN